MMTPSAQTRQANIQYPHHTQRNDGGRRYFPSHGRLASAQAATTVTSATRMS